MEETKQSILMELAKLIPDIYVIQLRMVMAAEDGDLMFCWTVRDIMKEWSADDANEKKVCELLLKLCKLHFKS